MNETQNQNQKPPKTNSPAKRSANVEDSSSAFTEAVDQLNEYAHTATQYLQRRPLAVLAGACAVGMIGAWIVSSKDSRGSRRGKGASA